MSDLQSFSAADEETEELPWVEAGDPLLDELSNLFRFVDVVEEASVRSLVGRPLPLHPLRGTAPVVLVVDSDDVAREAAKATLVAAGYEVLVAATAVRGLILARSCVVDAVVVDAALDDGDGWGLLCALRGASAVAELKVILVGSDVDALQELACAGVGADACEDKAVDLVAVVDRVLARGFGVLAGLHDGAWGTLADVGVQALLDGCCRTGRCGRLTVDDGVSTFTVDFDQGVIANAAVVSSFDADDWLQPMDRQALLALLNVRDAPWSFERTAAPPTMTLALPWSRLARELCAELDDRRARVRAHLLAQPRAVTLDAARLALWMGRASDRAVAVANALVGGAAPGALIDESPTPLLVDEVLQDLVDRNVLLLLPEPISPRVRFTPTTAVRPAMAPRVSSRKFRKAKGTPHAHL